MDENDKNILDAWQAEWSSNICDDGQDVFYEFYTQIYTDVCKGNKKNMSKNFNYKKGFLFIYLGLLLLIIVVFFVVNFKLFINHEKIKTTAYIALFTIMFILLFLACAGMSKYLDIKKFQETWARHSMNLAVLKSEMIQYLCNIPPYDSALKNIEFIKKVLYLEVEVNQRIFFDNLMNKEKDLLDIFDFITSKGSLLNHDDG